MKKIAACAVVALLTACGLFAPPAQATPYLVTFEQVGSNVVATGSGAIDLTGLTLNTSFSLNPVVGPSTAAELTGAGPANIDEYTGASGPTSFGPGGATAASTGTGDLVGVQESLGGNPVGFIFVPMGYVFGATLSDTATYDSTSFATLGLTPGTYDFTWGTGADQTLTVQVGAAAVPEPGSLALLGTALAGLGLLRRRRRA